MSLGSYVNPKPLLGPGAEIRGPKSTPIPAIGSRRLGPVAEIGGGLKDPVLVSMALIRTYKGPVLSL